MKSLKKKSAGGRIKLDEISAFSRQLATMVRAGLPIYQILGILSQQTESKNFQKVIAQMQEHVGAGNSLSEAMQRHPQIFAGLYTSMVKAGEASGALDEILNRLSDYLESSSKLQKKIKSSMMYPLAIVIMAAVITAFLLLKVVPTFKGIFEGLGGKLPLPTVVLLKVSDIFRKYFFFVLGALFALGYLFKMYRKTAAGKFQIDKLSFRLPVIGKLVKKIVVARFCRTFATLIKSGVPILTSMEIVAATSGNRVMELAVVHASHSIRDGQSIAEPLAQAGIFPLMVTKMISVGEEVGTLDEMLSKVADFYESEVDAAVSGLTSLIEPLIMVFLGVVIGGIALAIFLPIFKITELIH